VDCCGFKTRCHFENLKKFNMSRGAGWAGTGTFHGLREGDERVKRERESERGEKKPGGVSTRAFFEIRN
jgi:hypothetical protein